MEWGWSRAASVACLLWAVTGCGPATEPPPAGASAFHRPNILLVTIDTVRADHTSVHGYARRTTPFLEELAAEGVRFDRAYATSSWTVPSIASILTALPPSQHGVTRGFVHRGRAVDQQVLSDEHVLLAEALREAGYRTVGVTANGHLREDMGFAQGFDHYVNIGFLAGRRLNHELQQAAERLTGPAPWFLWVHYFDPHGPYTEREGTRTFLADEAYFDAGLYASLQTLYERDDLAALELRVGDRAHRYVTALYDGEIRHVDEEIRALVDDLELDERDLIVVTSDHGEEFFEHGDCWHGHTLYEETVRVPLVLRLPGRARAGTVVDHPVGLTALMPTILEAAGVPPAGAEPGLFAPPRPVRASLALYETQEMFLDWPYKTVLDRDSGRQSLFDLAADPGETADLSGAREDLAAALKERLERSVLERKAFAAVESALTEEQADQLRALGYVN